PYRSFEIAEIRCVDVGKFDAIIFHDLVEQAKSSAVDVFGADSVVILLQQKLCDRGNRRHSRRKSVTGAARFQHRHVLFKRRACWILRSSVFEAFMFAEAFLDVGGGLVDGIVTAPVVGSGSWPAWMASVLKPI